MDAVNKGIISYRTGKRDWSTTGDFLADLRMRVLGTPMISSDGFVAYEEMMRMTFGETCHYGQIIKNYAGEPPIDAARRYSPGALVNIERKVISGAMPKLSQNKNIQGTLLLAAIRSISDRLQSPEIEAIHSAPLALHAEPRQSALQLTRGDP